MENKFFSRLSRERSGLSQRSFADEFCVTFGGSGGSLIFQTNSSSNVEKHYVFQRVQAQMLKRTTLFNNFKLKCWKTRCFSMLSSSNAEKQRFSTFSRSYRSYRGGRDMQRLLLQIISEVFRKVFLSFAEGFARVGAPSRGTEWLERGAGLINVAFC